MKLGTNGLTVTQTRQAIDNTGNGSINKAGQVAKALQNSGYYIGLDRNEKTPACEAGANDFVCVSREGQANYDTG